MSCSFDLLECHHFSLALDYHVYINYIIVIYLDFPVSTLSNCHFLQFLYVQCTPYIYRFTLLFDTYHYVKRLKLIDSVLLEQLTTLDSIIQNFVFFTVFWKSCLYFKHRSYLVCNLSDSIAKTGNI